MAELELKTQSWLTRTHPLNSIHIIIATEYSVLTMCPEQHLIHPHNSVRPLLLLFLFYECRNGSLEEEKYRTYGSSSFRVLSAGLAFLSPSAHLELFGHHELRRG